MIKDELGRERVLPLIIRMAENVQEQKMKIRALLWAAHNSFSDMLPIGATDPWIQFDGEYDLGTGVGYIQGEENLRKYG